MGENDSRTQELEVINTAFFLEGTLAELRKDMKRLDGSKPAKPAPPKKPALSIPQISKEDYPAIPEPEVPFPRMWKIAAIACVAVSLLGTFIIPSSSDLSKNWPMIASVILVVGVAACCVIGGRIRSAEKNRIIEAHVNSAEYKTQCEQIDQRNASHQKQAEEAARERLTLATQEYEQKLLPAYEQSLALYNEETLPEYKAEQTALQEAINSAEAALQEVYDRNILPGKYRNLTAVTFLAAFMGTSQYDLKFSIERYDKDIDQLLARENGQIQQAQAAMQSQILQEAQYSNYLNEQMRDILADSNDVLRSTRSWIAADTAMHAYDIQQRRKREKEAKKRR